jgi:hypothetical protein
MHVLFVARRTFRVTGVSGRAERVYRPFTDE